ncbi:MAG: hypothetical protein J6I96_03925 [Oscillospiraceae bacterium]|nr:hypothetical protein [Oscillospiraceae bacterium]
MKKSVIGKAMAVVIAGTAALSCLTLPASAATVVRRTVVRRTVVQQSMPFSPVNNIGTYRRTSSGYINQNIGQAVYTSGSKQLILRKARGATGMRSTYPIVYRTYSAGCSVVLKGNNQGYYSAEWTKNGFLYSVSSNVPLTQTMFCNYITSATLA